MKQYTSAMMAITVCLIATSFGYIDAAAAGGNAIGEFSLRDYRGKQHQLSDYADAKVVVLAFLGNSADRWANSRAATERDVRQTLDQIPKDVPCIFLTTAPVFSKETNDIRMRAQSAVADAFERANGHCKVVKGFTRQTRAAIEGNKRFFRQDASGELADPLHPNAMATRLFLESNMPRLCDAVFSVLK